MKERNEKRKDEGKSRLCFLLVFFLFSVVAVVLGILCFSQMPTEFMQRNLIPLSIAWAIFICGLCAIFVWLMLSGKEGFGKGGLSLYTLLCFALFIWFILLKTGFFEVVKSSEQLRLYLEKTGVWMPIFYILLQFLQVIILPIPSIVSTVAGIALFGAFWTMIYSLAGILSGSIVAFFVGRKLGYRAVAWIVGEESLKKWQKKMKGKDRLFFSLAFLLPVFPDDILCFLAGLSTMSTGYFVAIIMISRVLAISATCYSFQFIPFNTWWGLTLWGIIVAAMTAIFIVLYKNLDKLQALFKRKKRKKRSNEGIEL